jgi:ABC-type branched-subunit amino acid transport system substrate-binding protein/TolA-binding protein
MTSFSLAFKRHFLMLHHLSMKFLLPHNCKRLLALVVTIAVCSAALVAQQQQYARSAIAEERFNASLRLFQQGAYSQAADGFEEIIASASVNQYTTASYVMAAKARFENGECDKADELAHQFLKTFPLSKYAGDAYYTEGLCNLRAGKFRESVDNFALARKISPDTAVAFRSRGMLAYVIGSRVPQADIVTNRAPEIRRDTPADIIFLYAKRLFDARDYADAKDFLDSTLSHSPSSDLKNTVWAMRDKIAGAVDVKVAVMLPFFRNSSPNPIKTIADELSDGISFALDRAAPTLPPGVTVKLDLHDSEQDTTLAKNITTDLGSQQDVVAMIGPMFSPMSFACAPIANRDKLPMISPTANATGLSATGKYVFQTNPDLEIHGRALARYAVSTLGLKTFALLFPDKETVRPLVESFFSEVRRLGGSVVASEVYTSGSDDLEEECINLRKVGKDGAGGPAVVSFAGRMSKDQLVRMEKFTIDKRLLDSVFAHKGSANIVDLFGPYATAIADSLGLKVAYPKVSGRDVNDAVTSFDGIFVPVDDPDEISVLLSQLSYYNFKTQLLGSGEWYDLNSLSTNKTSASGVVFCSDTYVNKDAAEVKAFVSEFTKDMAKVPSKYTMFGYDVMNLILKNIEAGATTREKLAAALAATADFHGIHTTISLDKERVNTVLNVLRFKDGAVSKLDDISVR